MAGGVGGAAAGGGRPVPPGEAKGAPPVGHLIAAAALGLNLALIFAWPWLGPGARDLLDPVYRGLCHRLPGRSYLLGGEPMPVCARCVGVWLGLALMAVIVSLAGVCRLRTGLLLLGWMLASWVLGGLVLPESWHVERTLGGVAGGTGAYVVAARLPGLARGGVRVARGWVGALNRKRR